MASDQDLVMGIDLMAMCSPSGLRQPRYAVVVIRGDGEVVERHEDVSRRRLVKLVWKFKPKILAVDNVFELASSPSKLVKFLSLLPAEVKLVQVTGSPLYGFKPLKYLARAHGLFAGGKLSPVKAAELSARLALRGVGYVACLVKGETRIVVCRRRVPGEGGMSEDRFERKIRTSVLRVAREIKESLDSHGFDYDLFVRKGKHGFDSCLFIVYAPRDELKGVVKSMKSSDVRVLVKREPSRKLTFAPISGEEPLGSSARDYLIVGVDPGVVTGVAAINLFGRLVLLMSKRHLSRSQLISALMEHGHPILIATDVNPPPSFVEKLASMLRAPTFYPPQSLTVSEKQEIIKRYFDEFKLDVRGSLDSHKRDALAAALKAFMNFRNKFEQAEAHAREAGAAVSSKELRALIIKGYSIRDAIEKLTPKVEEPPPPKVEVKQPVERDEVRELKEKLKAERRRVKALLAQREQLASRIEELEKKVRELERTIELLQVEMTMKIKKEREVAALESRISQLTSMLNEVGRKRDELERKLSEWRGAFNKLLRGELIPLKPFRNLSKDDALKSLKCLNVRKGDAIYVHDLSLADPEAVKELSKIGVKCIVGSRRPPAHVLNLLEENVIPFISADEVELTWIDEHPLADRILLDKLASEIKAKLMRMAEDRETSRIKSLFEEYRRERLESLKDLDFALEY
ncbi:MAG: hypothetical protein DRJ18_02340 [Candidatus Methanomethylicota archaeon]|nr:MAG: hypothetical protein DRJ18_02340 [Candidatus Verstraetearchaeota archaeon]